MKTRSATGIRNVFKVLPPLFMVMNIGVLFA